MVGGMPLNNPPIAVAQGATAAEMAVAELAIGHCADSGGLLRVHSKGPYGP